MNLSLNNPNLDLDLADMNQAQLLGQIMHMRNQLQALEQFQKDAFTIYPNIDLDIEYTKRLK